MAFETQLRAVIDSILIGGRKGGCQEVREREREQERLGGRDSDREEWS